MAGSRRDYAFELVLLPRDMKDWLSKDIRLGQLAT